MEHGKVRMGITAGLIVGSVFMVIGSFFFFPSLFLWTLFGWNRQTVLVAGIFCAIGLALLIPGVIILCLYFRKKQAKQRALDGGRYFFAEVVDVEPNSCITVLGRNPVHLVVSMQDPQGITHVFKSREILLAHVPDLIGRQVKVYAEQDHLENYYVDAEPLLETIQIHN